MSTNIEMQTAIAFGILFSVLSALAASSKSFQADISVSNSISGLLNHVKSSIKAKNPKHIAGTFPPTQGSKLRVNVFTDLPV